MGDRSGRCPTKVQFTLFGHEILSNIRAFHCGGKPVHIMTPLLWFPRSGKVRVIKCRKCGSIGNYRVNFLEPITVFISAQEMRVKDLDMDL